jgi:16S rRNA (adenine1518-N6/adenine1519-N6)-dimethyltransferase
VANLPYHITTPLLEKCFALPFISLTLMIQKEVATRLLAKPNSKDFGSLTLFSQFYAQITSHFTVSPNCFYPKPTVDSTVIHLIPKPIPCDPTTFFALMRKAFQQRRKMISSSLGPQAKGILRSLNLREDARPEMLSLEEWVLFTSNWISDT